MSIKINPVSSKVSFYGAKNIKTPRIQNFQQESKSNKLGTTIGNIGWIILFAGLLFGAVKAVQTGASRAFNHENTIEQAEK